MALNCRRKPRCLEKTYGLHTEETQQGFKPEPSRCEVRALATMPPCNPLGKASTFEMIMAFCQSKYCSRTFYSFILFDLSFARGLYCWADFVYQEMFFIKKKIINKKSLLGLRKYTTVFKEAVLTSRL